MNDQEKTGFLRVSSVLLVAVVLLVLFSLLDLAWAPRFLSIGEVVDVLLGKGLWGNEIIVKEVNAPRVVIGIFVGAGLGVSGAVMQALFRNPMASPYILGLSSGASMGAAIGILFAIPFIPKIVVVPILAFTFCLMTMFLVYSIARVGGYAPTETLLLSGIAVGALIQAVVSFLTFISGEKLEGIVFWTMGSLSQHNWNNIFFVIPMVLIGISVMLTKSRELNAMMLGDAHAMDLGVDVRKTRLMLLVFTSLTVAACVAFVGIIGFVGLVIPHIFRLLLGPDNRLVMPMAAVGGSAFVIMCDFIAHVIAPKYGVMPIGVVTAMIGAPYFIYLLTKRKREVGWN